MLMEGHILPRVLAGGPNWGPPGARRRWFSELLWKAPKKSICFWGHFCGWRWTPGQWIPTKGLKCGKQ